MQQDLQPPHVGAGHPDLVVGQHLGERLLQPLLGRRAGRQRAEAQPEHRRQLDRPVVPRVGATPTRIDLRGVELQAADARPHLGAIQVAALFGEERGHLRHLVREDLVSTRLLDVGPRVVVCLHPPGDGVVELVDLERLVAAEGRIALHVDQVPDVLRLDVVVATGHRADRGPTIGEPERAAPGQVAAHRVPGQEDAVRVDVEVALHARDRREQQRGAELHPAAVADRRHQQEAVALGGLEPERLHAAHRRRRAEVEVARGAAAVADHHQRPRLRRIVRLRHVDDVLGGVVEVLARQRQPFARPTARFGDRRIARPAGAQHRLEAGRVDVGCLQLCYQWCRICARPTIDQERIDRGGEFGRGLRRERRGQQQQRQREQRAHARTMPDARAAVDLPLSRRESAPACAPCSRSSSSC